MRQVSSEVKLRAARPDEAAVLSALCMRSKAFWGYDEAFMEACRQELALTPESMANAAVIVADRDGEAVGVVQVSIAGGIAVLEKLFVSPDVMGAGVGRLLFEWAKCEAVRHGARVLTIDADPGAADFYRRLGATDDGWVSSGSITGRRLPRLRLRL